MRPDPPASPGAGAGAGAGPGYPLLLDLRGRSVVVVGGGRVAARRAQGCVDAGARVLVVAPELGERLRELRDAGAVAHLARPWQPEHLEGARLVHACTDDAEVNAAVAEEAERRATWCVRADDAPRSAAWVPAVSRHDDVVVAVSAGGDPRRAARLRTDLALLLDAGAVSLRAERQPSGTGSVALVGGGPGDPGLLTVRARRLLAAADVVVADRLGPRAALADLDPGTVVVDVGKSPHGTAPSTSQDEINRVLVEHALQGRRVVRLKGGDPFVFGRGGEEALACVAAGVPFEVVPGVSSAVAVPAAVGIPVTHRGVAQSFSVVSAHLDPGAPGSTVDWAAVARTGGTLVLLMGVRRLRLVAEEMVAAGRAPSTPVAVVRAGTTADEEVVVGTLADVADAAAHLEPPAVVVIGDVVALRARLAAGGA